MERARVTLSQIRKDIDSTHPDAKAIENILAYADALALTPSTPEKPIEVVRFSPEARETLERKGFVVYELIGQSIATLRDAGRLFKSDWHKDYPEFEALTSRRSEVAFSPGQLFLQQGTIRIKAMAQQKRQIAEFSEELGIKGVQAIIGSAPDYIDLTFTHRDATGERLFGEDYGSYSTRTTTPVDKSNLAIVGNYSAGKGLSVLPYRPDRHNFHVRVAPLIVPA